MIYNLGESYSVASQYLLELRDKEIQRDRMRFRANVERLGSIMAYEISKHLTYQPRQIETPLSAATAASVEMPVLMAVLRAGLPYFEGFLKMFDHADCGFIGAYRKEGSPEVTIQLQYATAPPLSDKVVILIDPMLATARSMVKSINELQSWGTPRHVHFASLVAAPEGLHLLASEVGLPHDVWTFAIDEKLDEDFYIVPGLGDAGDLSFGEKRS